MTAFCRVNGLFTGSNTPKGLQQEELSIMQTCSHDHDL